MTMLHLVWVGGPIPESAWAFRHTWGVFDGVTVHDDLTIAQDPKLNWALQTPWYKQAIVDRPLAAKDLMRLVVLHAYGGVYSDWDVEWLEPLAVPEDGRICAGYEDEIYLCNAVLAAPAEHNMLQHMVNLLIAQPYRGLSKSKEWGLRGPTLLTDVAMAFPGEFSLKRPEVFYPLHWKTRQLRVTENTVCIHHYDDSPTLKRSA